MVYPFRKLRKVARRYPGTEMMLDVEKHIKGDRILQPVSQRPRNVVGAIAMMMNGPDREEGRKTLSGCHNNYVISKHLTMQQAEHECDPQCTHS